MIINTVRSQQQFGQAFGRFESHIVWCECASGHFHGETQGSGIALQLLTSCELFSFGMFDQFKLQYCQLSQVAKVTQAR